MSRPIAVIDLETDPFKRGRYPEPFAAGLYDGDEYWQWWGADCVEQALLFLCEKEWIVYAHNGGKFDYHFMLNYFNEWDKVRIINGRLASFFIGECEFRDSFNILPVPLSAYQKDKIDYKLFEVEEREKPKNKKEISKYLESDCIYLYDLVSAFVGEYGLYITQASAAMKFWQKQSEVKAPKSDKEYYDKFKQYYFGGRVECFQKGQIEGKFLSVDINSAYPFVMQDGHPIGLSYFTLTDVAPAELQEKINLWITGFFSIVAESRGALPYRAEDGGLVFPCDNEQRVYHVTGHEIAAGLETGTLIIIDVLVGYIHDETINFDEYVHHFYDLRLIAKAEGDKKTDIICKIFMNALYGKFASNPEKYKEYCIGDIKSLEWAQDALNYEFAGTLGGNLLLKRDLDDESTRYFNICTSASITGAVRAYLWRAICACDTPLYCDTDCIVARGTNVKKSKMLGDWEVEGYYDSGAIAGKKLYAFKYDKNDPRNKKIKKSYKKASKGVRLKAKEIIKVAKGQTITYKSKAPSYSVYNVPNFIERKVKML